MEVLRQDLQYAVRVLLRQPSFTWVRIVTLALGIGANAAVFSVVHATLLRPLPFRDADRLMVLSIVPATAPGEPPRFVPWPYPRFLAFRSAQQAFSELATYRGHSMTVAGIDEAERVFGEMVSSEYFAMLGVRVAVGRTFLPAEDQTPDAHNVVVLGHAIWQRRFGADPEIVGRTVVVEGKPHTVVGVLAPGFTGLTGISEIWRPSVAAGAEDLGLRRGFEWEVIGRLRRDATVEQARAASAALGDRLDEADPVDGSSRWGVAARPLAATRTAPLIRSSVLLLFGGALVVLMIACTNNAGLAIERASARRREIAIRLAAGATRGRLVRQLLTESLLLALAGGVAGLLVAVIGVRWLETVNPASGTTLFGNVSGLALVGLNSIRIDGAVLLFLLCASVASGLLLGLLPALHASRGTLSEDLRDMPVYRSGGGIRGRSALVVGEIALSLVLLISAGLLLKSLFRRLSVDPGTATENVLTFRLALSETRLTAADRVARLEDIESRLGALPNVLAAGLADCPPVAGRCGTTALWFRDRPGTAQARVGRHVVSTGYFDALRIPRLRGRNFTPADRLGAPKVALVSATAARTLWPGDDPVGKRIALGMNGFGDRVEVIGVVGDARYGALEEPPRADVYVSYRQSPGSTAGFVRTTGDPVRLVDAIRSAARDVDPTMPIYETKTMKGRLRAATVTARFGATVLAVFAGIALILAAVGVYGVVSQAVSSRTREIGIRVALGAEPRDVLRLVLAHGLALAVAGVGLGLGGAVMASHGLRARLYEVAEHDVTTYASVSVVLTVVALLAAYVPARRAMRLDALVTLRAE